MFVVDTNVFLYAVNVDCAEHEVCARLLDDWRASSFPWYTTWPIVYEFCRVSTHPRVWTRPWSVGEAWGFVAALSVSPALRFLVSTERHQAVAKQVFEDLPDLKGNLLHDAHTAILMREHGIRQIYTRDTDFHRFPFLEVVDPLRI